MIVIEFEQFVDRICLMLNKIESFYIIYLFGRMQTLQFLDRLQSICLDEHEKENQILSQK
jgi:hypothetical protein